MSTLSPSICTVYMFFVCIGNKETKAQQANQRPSTNSADVLHYIKGQHSSQAYVRIRVPPKMPYLHPTMSVSLIKTQQQPACLPAASLFSLSVWVFWWLRTKATRESVKPLSACFVCVFCCANRRGMENEAEASHMDPQASVCYGFSYFLFDIQVQTTAQMLDKLMWLVCF